MDGFRGGGGGAGGRGEVICQSEVITYVTYVFLKVYSFTRKVPFLANFQFVCVKRLFPFLSIRRHGCVILWPCITRFMTDFNMHAHNFQEEYYHFTPNVAYEYEFCPL